MKRGPRRQRSNGFLIHEETGPAEAEPVGQRYMEGGGAVRGMHGQSGEATILIIISSLTLHMGTFCFLSPSLAEIHLSSCEDRIPRRPHRQVTFGIIILLSSSPPSPPSPPPPHGTCSPPVQKDELAFLPLHQSTRGPAPFHNFQIHRIFTLLWLKLFQTAEISSASSKFQFQAPLPLLISRISSS